MTTETAIEPQQEKHLAIPISEIPPLIKERLKKINDATQDYETITADDRKEIGELLLDAKSQVAEGGWYRWLKKNFNWSTTTAQRYMALAKTRRATHRVSFAEAMRKHVNPDYGVPRWKEPVKDLVDRARRQAQILLDHELTRKQEREAERKLGLQMIDIGYKILSAKLHPDKAGGSHEAMTRLNAVRMRLKQAA